MTRARPGTSFAPADAWVLLAARVATSGAERVSVEALRKAGDYINHAILTDAEIEHALDFLEPRQLLSCRDGRFALGARFAEFWSSIGAERLGLHRQLDALEDGLARDADHVE